MLRGISFRQLQKGTETITMIYEGAVPFLFYVMP